MCVCLCVCARACVRQELFSGSALALTMEYIALALPVRRMQCMTRAGSPCDRRRAASQPAHRSSLRYITASAMRCACVSPVGISEQTQAP